MKKPKLTAREMMKKLKKQFVCCMCIIEERNLIGDDKLYARKKYQK